MAKPREFYTKIKGVTFNCPVTGIPRQKIIKKYLKERMRLHLRPEHDNPKNKRAVAVWMEKSSLIGGKKQFHLGYLEDRFNDFSAKLDKGQRIEAYVNEISGGVGKKSTLGVRLFIRVYPK